MSASRKKMLRREQNAAAMTERQKKERKEARKLRLYTVAFSILLIVIVAVAGTVAVLNSGIIARSTTAMTVNDKKLNAVELNYYYVDSINNYMNTYGSYASMMGLDTTQPLDEQYFNEEAGQTWADYMLEMASSNAQYCYALYQEAKDNGYTLSEEAQQTLDNNLTALDNYANIYGYSSANSYLKALYGEGSNEKSYREYLTIQTTANDYYTSTVDSMVYTDAELRAAEAEKYNNYSSFSYNYYYLNASLFNTGGTVDDEGVVSYTDEEIAAGVASCKETAELMAASSSLEELEDAIDALSFNEGNDFDTTAVVDQLYSSVDASLQEWVTSADRKEGDITSIENSTTTTDEDGNEVTTVNGYYLVYYVGANDNTFPLVNVRHILLQHEGGTTDDYGNTTYTDAEKSVTMAEAVALLTSFETGADTSEDAFAALANEQSEDPGSNTNGGLYENVYPGQMVETFNDWCFDENRKPGDTDVVETEYGCHVMYFSGLSDTNYRDYMISTELRDADTAQWESTLLDAVTVEIVNDSYVNKSVTLGSAEQ